MAGRLNRENGKKFGIFVKHLMILKLFLSERAPFQVSKMSLFPFLTGYPCNFAFQLPAHSHHRGPTMDEARASLCLSTFLGTRIDHYTSGRGSAGLLNAHGKVPLVYFLLPPLERRTLESVQPSAGLENEAPCWEQWKISGGESERSHVWTSDVVGFESVPGTYIKCSRCTVHFKYFYLYKKAKALQDQCYLSENNPWWLVCGICFF